jgi:glyoxylase-like metal-dependent hydrolase (beta-lactamase superfamily II)
MHPLDIPMAESGGPFRPMTPAPGLLGQVLCRLFFNPEERMEPVAIDQPLTPGDTLPIAGGIEVIHVPGHCAGQVALLWHPGRMEQRTPAATASKSFPLAILRMS